MAISRDKKQQAVAEISDLLGSSKMTVFALYEGLNVSDAQELRKSTKNEGTVVKVVKNRLFKVALARNDELKSVDQTSFNGQLLYAFNDQDEVLPVKHLVEFGKSHPALKVTGAFNSRGEMFDESQIEQLATLPSKPELRAKLVGTINAPVSGFVNVVSGNLRGLVQVLNARAQEMNN